MNETNVKDIKEAKSAKKDVPKKKDELDIFLAGTYTLTDSTVIDRPKLAWGKQIKLLRHFSALLAKVPELREVNFEAFTIRDLVQVLPSVLDNAPDSFSEMCSLILDKDRAWVDENLSIDDIMGLIVPFLRGLFSRIGRTFRGEGPGEGQ